MNQSFQIKHSVVRWAKPHKNWHQVMQANKTYCTNQYVEYGRPCYCVVGAWSCSGRY